MNYKQCNILLFFYSFHILDHFILLNFFQFLPTRLEGAVLVPIPKPRFTHGLIYSLRMCLRTFVCRTSPPPCRMFLSETCVFHLTLRFSLLLQKPTSMTTAYLSSPMSLILMCLERFTTGHTRRNSMWRKIDLG